MRIRPEVQVNYLRLFIAISHSFLEVKQSLTHGNKGMVESLDITRNNYPYDRDLKHIFRKVDNKNIAIGNSCTNEIDN